MEQKSENRSHWLKIRLRPSEYQAIEKRYKKTTFQTVSEFGRAMLMGKAVTVLYRDKSMDQILEELVLLRKELNAVGNNLNQAVRNINSAKGNADNRLWLGLLNVITNNVEPAITSIKNRVAQYADIWLQKSKAGKV